MECKFHLLASRRARIQSAGSRAFHRDQPRGRAGPRSSVQFAWSHDTPTSCGCDRPTDRPTDPPTDRPTDLPTDRPTHRPTDPPKTIHAITLSMSVPTIRSIIVLAVAVITVVTFAAGAGSQHGHSRGIFGSTSIAFLRFLRDVHIIVRQSTTTSGGDFLGQINRN